MGTRNDAGSQPIPFGRAYAQSDVFRDLFRDGMALVEETAAYLDGDGRKAARSLSRPASVVYATESMRLTTRLMQIASWLLLHRSVNEGELTIAQAEAEKRKIRFDRLSTDASGPGWEQLPLPFVILVERSLALQMRVERIEASLGDAPTRGPARNPVASQLDALAHAFAKDR